MTNFAIGGTERQVVSLCRGLVSVGVGLHLACLRRKGHFLPDMEALGVPLVEYPIRRLYDPGSIAARLRLARYVRRHRIDIVHAYGFYANLFAVPAARLVPGCRVVASVRDVGDRLTPRQQRVEAFVCRAADAILANAQAVREHLVALGHDPGRVDVVLNGIDGARLRPLGSAPWVRRELGIAPDAHVVTTLCRLTPTKGVDVFLEAAAQLAPRFPGARFLVVGEGPTVMERGVAADPFRRQFEQRAAALGLGGRVTFTGPRLDVPELLAESTVSVLASLTEGLSNSLLESSAAGLPVVATRVGASGEIVEDGRTGFLVPPRDPAALAGAIGMLLERPELRREFGLAGKRRVAERFSVEQLVHGTQAFYDRLLAGPRHPARAGATAGSSRLGAVARAAAGAAPARGPAGSGRGGLTVETVDDPAVFAGLRAEWTELLAASAAPSVFLTWEWLHTWWTHLGGSRRLAIVTVRRGTELQAIAPLSVRPASPMRLEPFRAREFLGVGSVGSDYLDVIVRRGAESRVLDALADHLGASGLMVELSRVRPGESLAGALAARLAGRGWRTAETPTDVCPYIELGGHSWESYLGTLGTDHRYNVRRRLRNAARAFAVRFERVRADGERRDALRTLFDLHDRRWREREGTTAFHTARLRAFHEDLSRTALDLGWLRLFVLTLDGAPAAALYGLVHGGTFSFYQSGFDPAYARHSVGLVTMALAIQSAIAEGAREFDMLHGDEAYKFHWALASRPLVRLDLYPPRAAGLAHMLPVVLGRAARRLARRVLPAPVTARLAAAHGRDEA